MLIKRAIHHEAIMILNIYAPNIGVSSFVKQILLDIMGQIGPDTINSV
jgi:hypothetical protein